MLCLKKVYSDELLQLAILLSLLRADNRLNLIEAPAVGVGTTYDSWDIGRSMITSDMIIHPKAIDTIMLREQDLFNELNSLGRYNSLWQDVTAYMGLTNTIVDPVASTSSDSSSSPQQSDGSGSFITDFKEEPADDLTQEVKLFLALKFSLRMEELLSQLKELTVTVDVLDGYKMEDVPSKMAEFKVKLQHVRKFLTEYQEALKKTEEIIDKHKLAIEHLEALNRRISFVKQNIPRHLRDQISKGGGGDASSVPSQIKISTPAGNGNFPSPITNSTQNNFTISTMLGESSYLSVDKFTSSSVGVYDSTSSIMSTQKKQGNENGTPKPRKDLEASINYISNNEFDAIPQYMKGRLKATEVNKFVDTYNTVLNKKLMFLRKPKNSLKLKKDLDQWLEWKTQMENPDLMDQHFCTAKDFDTQAALKLGKREFSMLTILRHVKRIKEVRAGKQAVYYVACF